jgi:hypothetical protein
MTHVPGPWIAVGQSVYAQTPQDIDHNRYRGYNEREPHGFLISESTPHPATCRLIAAAPDLLKALRELTAHTIECERRLDEFHGLGNDAGSGSSICVTNAQEAIKRAEGLGE